MEHISCRPTEGRMRRLKNLAWRAASTERGVTVITPEWRREIAPADAVALEMPLVLELDETQIQVSIPEAIMTSFMWIEYRNGKTDPVPKTEFRAEIAERWLDSFVPHPDYESPSDEPVDWDTFGTGSSHLDED